VSNPISELMGDFDLFREEVPVEGSWQVGPIQIKATYPKEVLTLPASALPDRLLAAFNVFKDLPRNPEITVLPRPVAELPEMAQRWLLYAMYLLAANKETHAAFRYMDAGVWLAERIATTEPAALRAEEFDFEFQVLGRTGWLYSVLDARSRPLDDQTRKQVGELYSVAAAPVPSGSRQQPGVLNPPVLEELVKELLVALSAEARRWVVEPPAVRESQLIQELYGLADWVQFGAWRLFQPYAAARRDGPFVERFRSSLSVYDKTAAQPTDAQLHGYVLNRMKVIGGRGEAGKSIFSRAGYNGGRDADKQALDALATRWLGIDPKHKALVSFLVRHTGSHGAGRIGVVTEFLPGVSKATWRWRNIRTLIHELGHALIHPDLTAAAQRIGNSQVITEGFVEVFTRELYNKIIDTRTPEMQAFALSGIERPEDPVRTEVGYEEAGKAAAGIFTLVGPERFYRAFFNGDVHEVCL
jgi:hypothetical protein